MVLNMSVRKVSSYVEDDGRSGSGVVRTSCIDNDSGCGAYPFACSVGTALSFPGRKAAGV